MRRDKLKFHWDQFPRNFLVTSWRLSRNICYGEVTGKLVPVEFELEARRARSPRAVSNPVLAYLLTDLSTRPRHQTLASL